MGVSIVHRRRFGRRFLIRNQNSIITMETLVISKQDAKNLYPSASPEFKTVLESTFGKPFFSQKITDRVKTFEDACEVLGIDLIGFVDDDNAPDESAYIKLKTIIKALNEGWTPDWNNDNQPKYWPWFHLEKTKSNPSGFRLFHVGYYCYSDSAVGSRLCFKSRELAEYAAKQFEDLYKQFLTI
jgi:hypothetical protein